jgi:hypothetical protein
MERDTTVMVINTTDDPSTDEEKSNCTDDTAFEFH